MNKVNTPIKVEGEFKGKKISLETGKFAMQADSAVVAKMGDTTVMATVVSKPTKEVTDFFPLRIDYEEKFYAGGIIGGSRFTRREGRPNDESIISGRLIDHAVRPLFPKDFMYDTQLVVTVLSIDNEVDPALLGFYAASAALSTAGIPFNGPIVPMRITRVNGDLKADISIEDESSEFSIIASYLEEGAKVQAIEAHAHIIPEKDIVEALKFGAKESKDLFKLLAQYTNKIDAPIKEYKQSWLNKDEINKYTDEIMKEILSWVDDGLSYKERVWGEKKSDLVEKLIETHEDEHTAKEFSAIIGEVEKIWVRDVVMNKNQRIDGRADDEVRPLNAEIGLLPRVHGTGLFSRGYTQSMSIATLASTQQKQLIQKMSGDENKYYMHHYNFPPYSTGEVGRIGGASRRDLGHGLLAEKALAPVLPDKDTFAYALRVVSEIFSSNGSTSMAATCSSSLSLMDAGVPIKAHVGGIGVGLFVDTEKENPSVSDYKLLTDIVGIEDFAGYMDFKMTGTREGITAIQLELKVQGIPVELLDSMFETSHTARMKVIDVMEAAIKEPKSEISEYAPKVMNITIPAEKIGKVIGGGGATIKDIMARTETEIDIEEIEGEEFANVNISGLSLDGVQEARDYIEGLTKEVKPGEIYEGEVTRVENYGAFVAILPGKEGLLHVSELSSEFVKDISQMIKVGDTVKVKVVSVDEDKGRVALSKKALEEN